ncbi:MAG: hypothetical protein ACM3S5_06105 [Rhodospirillales bacterium]
MNELIHTIMEKTGLDQGKASSAAETVINFLKERLPGQFGSQLDSVLGSGESEGTMGQIKKKAGSILGQE